MKPVQSNRISTGATAALGLTGRFGPSIDEVASPTVQVLDAGAYPYTPRGHFWTGHRVAAGGAGLFASCYLQWLTGPTEGVVAVVRRIVIFNPLASNQTFTVNKDVGPVAFNTIAVPYADVRRSTSPATPPLSGLSCVASNAAAAGPAGWQYGIVQLPANGQLELKPNFLINPVDGQALIVAQAAPNAPVAALFEGEVFELRRPFDRSIG